jgi:guanylate kinase
MKKIYPGNIIIVAAPSGAGKTSLVNALLKTLPNLKLSISHTTRQQRPGEIHGEHYWFISEAEFQEKIAANEFLEYARVFDHYYGTCKKWLLDQVAEGFDVVLEIDWQGAQIVRQHYPAALTIFILPPSIQALRERLYKRRQDSLITIEKRLQEAKAEIKHCHEFDYIVINDAFDKALADLSAIIGASHFRSQRQMWQHHALLDELMADE